MSATTRPAGRGGLRASIGLDQSHDADPARAARPTRRRGSRRHAEPEVPRRRAASSAAPGSVRRRVEPGDGSAARPRGAGRSAGQVGTEGRLGRRDRSPAGGASGRRRRSDADPALDHRRRGIARRPRASRGTVGSSRPAGPADDLVGRPAVTASADRANARRALALARSTDTTTATPRATPRTARPACQGWRSEMAERWRRSRITSPGRRSAPALSTSRPSCERKMRSASPTTSGLCVAITIVLPARRVRRSSRSSTCRPVSRSRFPGGLVGQHQAGARGPAPARPPPAAARRPRGCSGKASPRSASPTSSRRAPAPRRRGVTPAVQLEREAGGSRPP